MKKAVHIDSRAIKQSVVGVTRKFSCAIAGCPKFDAWNIKISRVREHIEKAHPEQCADFNTPIPFHSTGEPPAKRQKSPEK